jgi:hypothetical protein
MRRVLTRPDSSGHIAGPCSRSELAKAMPTVQTSQVARSFRVDRACSIRPSVGTYEARLHASGGWSVLTTSAPISVTASTATVSTSQPPISWVGSPVHVTWSGSMGASDWIGMFSVASGARVDFKFTSCANSLSPTPIQAGACAFVLPSPPGQYRFRLFSDGRWIELAISQPVTSAVNTVRPNGQGTVSRRRRARLGRGHLEWSGFRPRLGRVVSSIRRATHRFQVRFLSGTDRRFAVRQLRPGSGWARDV